MKITNFFAAFVLILSIGLFNSNLSAQDDNLEDVLQNHFEATGANKLAKIKTLMSTGKLNMGGMEIAIKSWAKRSGKFRSEGSLQGMKVIQASDGKTSWGINPFAGIPEPTEMSEDEAKALSLQADMDGQLFNYAKKGYTARLGELADIEGTDAYDVILENEEGGEFHFYIDTDSYLLLQSKSKMKMMGQYAIVITSFSNYKKIKGIVMAMSFSITNGNPESEEAQQMAGGMSFTLTEILLNEEVDDKLFEMPDAAAPQPMNVEPPSEEEEESKGGE